MLFRSDLCNADVAMGDLLIQKVRHALHSNMRLKCLMPIKLLCFKRHILLQQSGFKRPADPGDLVLFDRNNHKSNHHGAFYRLVQHRFIWKRHVTRMALWWH